MNNIEKTIFDSLASGKGINLPGIGVLFVERQSAELLSRGQVRPPQNKVSFSSSSNPAFISAETIPGYREWLTKAAQSGNVLEINGVGVLRAGVFYPSVELHGILNPGNNEPVKGRHKSSPWKKLFVGTAVVVAAGLVMWLVVSIDSWTRKETDYPEDKIAFEEQRDASARGESTIAPAVTAEAAADTEDQTVQTEAAKVEDVIQQQLESYASTDTKAAEKAAAGRTFHLVAGVFSDVENADKLIASDPLGIGGRNYVKLPFGDGKTLVSAYSSQDKTAVERRRRELSSLNGELWIYERKR